MAPTEPVFSGKHSRDSKSSQPSGESQEPWSSREREMGKGSDRSSEIDKEACGRTMASPDSKRSAQQPCMMVRPLTFGRGTFLQATTLEKEGEKVLGGFPTITTMSSGTRNRLGQDKD